MEAGCFFEFTRVTSKSEQPVFLNSKNRDQRKLALSTSGTACVCVCVCVVVIHKFGSSNKLQPERCFGDFLRTIRTNSPPRPPLNPGEADGGSHTARHDPH